MTISLAPAKGKLEPVRVTYYGHDWGYRFAWQHLEAIQSTSGDHAHVYVAFGSHASYPAKCEKTGLKCKQFDFKKYGQVLPDGRHDGEMRWYENLAVGRASRPFRLTRAAPLCLGIASRVFGVPLNAPALRRSASSRTVPIRRASRIGLQSHRPARSVPSTSSYVSLATDRARRAAVIRAPST